MRVAFLGRASGRSLALVLLLGVWLAPALGQEEPADPREANRLGPSHDLLGRLTGDYQLTTRFWPHPGAEPDVSRLPARRELILGGRVLETKVGPDPRGFHGAGHMGYDNLRRNYWYTWADTSTTGISILRGSLGSGGDGTLEGETPTPYGYSPLRVEIRYEGPVEIHDYWVPSEGSGDFRIIEHRYVRQQP